MSLSSLRPSQPTDLVALSSALRGRTGRRAALPTSLSEELLLSVARDLRGIEDPDDEPEDNFLAAPMMLVLTLMLGVTSGSRPKPERSFTEEQLFGWLHIYQWAIEREIVRRITGLGGSEDEEMLISTLGAAAIH